MMMEPPGLALADYSSIEIGAVTKHTTTITSTAATTDLCVPCGPASSSQDVSSNIDDADWCLTSCSSWKTMEGRRKDDGKLMIQNLTGCSFTKVCIDTGAGVGENRSDLHSRGRTIVGQRWGTAALL